MSVESEISRARKRPMDLAKMRDLLTKLRKGATATLSFGKLLQVLEHLGWKVDAVLDWTPRQYEYRGEEYLPVADTIRYGSLESLEARRAELQAVEVDGLPAHSPHLGQVVVADVGQIRKGSAHRDSFVYYFYWREWVGTEGLLVVSPAGVEQAFIPDHHDLDRGDRSLADGGSTAVHDVWKWLKENGALDDVNRALGTEKHVPAAQRTRENTGTCPACWGNFKLSDEVLVMHGYQRPGHGYIQGSCFCVGYRPLETSDHGAREFKKHLEGMIESERDWLRRLSSGEVDSIQWYGGRSVKKGEPSFERLLGSAVDKAEHAIKQLTAEVKLYGDVLGAWVARPMPKEGEPQRAPRFFLPNNYLTPCS